MTHCSAMSPSPMSLIRKIELFRYVCPPNSNLKLGPAEELIQYVDYHNPSTQDAVYLLGGTSQEGGMSLLEDTEMVVE